MLIGDLEHHRADENLSAGVCFPFAGLRGESGHAERSWTFSKLAFLSSEFGLRSFARQDVGPEPPQPRPRYRLEPMSDGRKMMGGGRNGSWSRRQNLSAVRSLAECMCAPFWWSVATPEDPVALILQNGTICYVDTSSRRIGITANHVYKAYLADKEAHDAGAIECQFGSSTIYPEKHVIDDSERWEIATFDLPDVFVGASILNPKSYNHAVRWPPQRAQKSDVVMYGGFPQVLREEKGSIAEIPFQWVAGRVSEVTDDAITLEPDFEKMQWQGPQTNDKIGGWSGGPVFRLVEDEPVARLELIGIIYWLFGQSVLARHADAVQADGTLRLR